MTNTEHMTAEERSAAWRRVTTSLHEFYDALRAVGEDEAAKRVANEIIPLNSRCYDDCHKDRTQTEAG